MNMTPTRESLVATYNTGALAEAIVEHFDGFDDEATKNAVSLCVELHNEGQIDLLAVAKSEAMKALPSHNFFSAQGFFVQAIPHLKASTDAMLSAVEALVAQGGEDGAANWPNSALRDWLGREPQRALDVIAAAEADSALEKRNLVFALQASNDLAQARALAVRFSDERRLSAITALGRMSHDEAEARASLALFQELLDQSGPDQDNLASSLCIAAMALLNAHEPLIGGDAVSFLERVLATAGDGTKYHAARALWSNERAYLRPELARTLLEPLRVLNPAHKGTLRELDMALSHLLKKGDAVLAVDFVTNVFGEEECEIELGEFPSFMRALRTSSLMAAVVVRWLKSGAPALCEGVVSLLGEREAHDRPLIIPNEVLAMSGREQAFVCRKALAYLFIHPVIAGSILVAFLRVAEKAPAQAIADLLFNPLLLNYGGELVDYLSALEATDPAYAQVQAALQRHSVYVEGCSAAGEVRELWPTERQRQMEYMRRADEAAETFKTAEKQSVLLSLVKRSVLLYGKNSVSYIKGPNDERRAIDMELGSHGFSIELPRMLTTDPLGLDYILRVYRVEQLAP